MLRSFSPSHSTRGGFPFLGGDVVKIPFVSPNNPTKRSSLALKMLLVPGGVAVGPDGAVYVSNRSAFLGPTGQVVRLSNR
jgi:hypothetical protein